MGCLHPINSMHANSPGYDNNLPVSRIGHQISRIKSSYELFFALIWNLSHFLPTFSPKIRILFDSKFVFWGIFARISSLTKISLRLPSQKLIVLVCTSCKTSYNVQGRLGTESNCAYRGGGGGGAGSGGLIVDIRGGNAKERVSRF